VLNVVGARPNFMKIAPIVEAMRATPEIEPRLVHTGQHYDAGMSDVFFGDLGIPAPDVHLGVGSGSHAEQTARVMVEFEKVCLTERPDLIVVVGDVNSTMACTLVGAKLGIPVAHVEAGLRSFDRTMPEEVNRIVTDALADLLFTTSRDADLNLGREGVAAEKIHFVGNVMIDTLLRHRDREKAARLDVVRQLGVTPRGYALVTLHRPSNVDDPEGFAGILGVLREIAETLPVVFPIHPRSRRRIAEFGLETGKVRIVDPFGYLEFLNLTSNARLVLTDSGGLQEETTILRVPCLTLRHNTERPVTVTHGTNLLVGPAPERIREGFARVMSGDWKPAGPPELWDGRSAERIVAVLVARMGGASPLLSGRDRRGGA
jgi:UDP-N-acetylglucosamine 2-epimerase (non-hydrolysing)